MGSVRLVLLDSFDQIKHLYHWSTYWEIGQGTLISFWFDTWNGQPLRDLKDGLPRPPFLRISLRDAWPLIPQLTPQLDHETVHFTQEEDEERWRWSTNGQYSANSFYKMVLAGGKIRWRFTYTWHCHTPLKVKVFTLLLLQGRILTRDVLLRRGIQCDRRCVLCNSCQTETANHIMFTCPYAKAVWEEIHRSTNTTIMVQGDSIQSTWDKSWQRVRRQGNLPRKEWASRLMCAVWLIWKQRNDKVFRGRTIPPTILANQIKHEGDLWMRFCRNSISREGIG